MSVVEDRHALVLGATGFLGRHLVLALGRAGVRVSTASRSHESYRRLARWLAEQGHGHETAPADLRVDFAEPSLIQGECDDVTEIYNCAGAYRFGMSADDAHRANVDSVRAVVAFAAQLPRLRRLVHVSGYRVGGQDPALWSDERRAAAYRALGPYEASKAEADAVFQVVADELGVPWSIVSPASVIGDSVTGESDQYLGLASSVKDLWRGSLPALPGNASTFVPVVAADYLARFMSLLPLDDAAERASYWLLDDDTPPLPDLLTLIAEHYRITAPRVRIPVSLVKRLPRRLTKADPETLTFLSSDRYPTASAHAFAARHGLTMPDAVTTIRRWADHLAAHRFGDAPADDRRFTTPGGIRTFELGDAAAPTVVMPGLPVNADTWAPVVTAMGGARAVDLPGLGMSGGHRDDWPTWLSALITETGARHLVGHSIGAAAAVEAAAAHPGAVERLTLVAPYFLQARPAPTIQWAPLTRGYLSHVSPEALAKRLTGTTEHASALRSSVADLRRGTVAANVSRLLAAAAKPRWREDLRAELRHYPGRVHVIVGSHDPLTPDGRALLDALPHATVTVVEGAGHQLQLTHPEEVAKAIASVSIAP
ncbi:putative NAD dependent epimerase/dehydratase family protein [Streptomyces himastatinicus ATCC 53653]|uniref:Putative NAD dependent epimerase/dehydratase family protein n=1 Tax=Streptomyces himastatinicus ATCC 53653 TaxID=457427 RepID=D9WNC5_9ACTN|nr:alpha/beta fold hydrolase [Streptomyces himastatinicus]EFL23822.1 putative NAD dependent epimerase/dehydratase family protein [Streptomyces himastatinicus ATCC 53653]